LTGLHSSEGARHKIFAPACVDQEISSILIHPEQVLQQMLLSLTLIILFARGDDSKKM